MQIPHYQKNQNCRGDASHRAILFFDEEYLSVTCFLLRKQHWYHKYIWDCCRRGEFPVGPASRVTQFLSGEVYIVHKVNITKTSDLTCTFFLISARMILTKLSSKQCIFVK